MNTCGRGRYFPPIAHQWTSARGECMSQEIEVYTETMAHVYASQGHWEKAAKVYRYLLEREPDRDDLADALTEAEQMDKGAQKKSPDDLVPLFREWIDLLFKHEKFQRLSRIRNKLKIASK
ncbi:MAG: hypothetical protein PVF53_14840 [Desulfobacterales bacterium]